MRVLHITPDYHPALGGGELYVKEVSERLAARGHDVTVLAMNSRSTRAADGKRLPADETIGGVRIRRLNNTYAAHRRLMAVRGVHKALGLVLDPALLDLVGTTPISLRALLFTLRAHADVVATSNWYHGALAYQTCAARPLGRWALAAIPLFHAERPWAHSAALTPLLAQCDAVVAMTEYEKQFIEQRSGKNNAHVAGAGVEPAAFDGADGRRIRAAHGLGDAPVVGYVGRIDSAKGVATLIQAMRLVWCSHPAARLLLAGSGLPPGERSDSAVRNAFAQLTEAERARTVCIDRFDERDKPAIFDALDIFAMPSVAESFGIAFLEAWMCRTAVIGSRTGATACVIQDGIDGLLVAPQQPGALAEAITLLLRSRPLREQMGSAGRVKTERCFTWDKVTDKIEHAYQVARDVRGGILRPHQAVA